MNPTEAGLCGRVLRLVFGVCVMIVALPVWFVAGWGYNLRSVGIMAALVLFYTLVHFVVSRYLAGLNRWIGAVLAVTPVFLVWFYGQGGGPLFGQGEGGTAAITYVGVSFPYCGPTFLSGIDGVAAVALEAAGRLGDSVRMLRCL